MRTCIANFFGHASPEKEYLGLSYGDRSLVVAQERFLLFWTDACPKKFAIQALTNFEATSQISIIPCHGPTGMACCSYAEQKSLRYRYQGFRTF